MIEIKNLSFAYEKTKILENFNLTISKGEVVLITGVNGVGKSTLLRLIAGALIPDRGKIVFPPEIGKDPRKKMGFISDQLSLYESLTIDQAIDFHLSFYDVNKFDDTLINHTKIKRTQKIKELSMGQRTIFHLSLVMACEPEILLIDEIIHSIDVYLRDIFLQQLITIISQREITVVMVNLNFTDIEGLLERVILLKDGKILVDENITGLKEKVKKITADHIPAELPLLFKRNNPQQTEFYVYPFQEDFRETINGDVKDLNLTEIIKAFIGKEYT
ncbi:MAG: ATP-binding cassette domain-containing protein [Candidatus Aminicenantes bacterium]|nr:ATP-binding cassette domain-containing protein [Candidatus Aminicenantes bacterium]NIM84348.1 ATP-binding cassette domain-containing protein [Candidatus Aminicenantes bacterium]NIN23834.1 ATP-binding cassette domain-containing protein [Candidatus Aminicenantes bacterium]NIN47550.1 ATP-binding cassette domain-containing protein [Candidatus Aminicenantes bacterium]NIN90470.1 ATP-binding cassette domain-containing protein [Candidatus Aminicenantes bacterium]